MLEKPNRNQWRNEAERICTNDDKVPIGAGVPLDELIQSYPLSKYAPPEFLRKTSSIQEFNELTRLLSDLCELNERFIGEKCREVEVFLVLTGQLRELQENLRKWSDRYIRYRLTQPNPKDDGDPFETFVRLIAEYDVITCVGTLRNTINYVVMDEVLSYSRWLVYMATWKTKINARRENFELLYRPIGRESPQAMAFYLFQHGWETPIFRDFTFNILNAFKDGDVPKTQNADVDGGLGQLKIIVEMILEMRAFLVDGFRPEKFAIGLPNGHFLVWRWIVRFGFACIVYVESERDLIESVRTNSYSSCALCSFEGILVDPNMPWQSVLGFPLPDRIKLMDINLHLLNQFFDKLYGAYEQIDFDAIRRANQRKLPSEVVRDEEFALACSDMAASHDEVSGGEAERPAVLRKPRVSSMKLSTLLNVLERTFDCEINQGKGSEITAYRPGGKKFVFGRHKENPTVSHVVVGRAISQLGVSRNEWVAEVYKAGR